MLNLQASWYYENGKGKLFPFDSFDSSFLNNLKNAKQMYYSHNLNLVSCRRNSLHALMFPISLLKKNLGSYWKWQTFERKIGPFFMTSKSRDSSTFVSCIF